MHGVKAMGGPPAQKNPMGQRPHVRTRTLELVWSDAKSASAAGAAHALWPSAAPRMPVLNCAAAPVPSTAPLTPVPDMRRTMPEGDTESMVAMPVFPK